MSATNGDTTKAKPAEKPRYQLTEKAYINDRLYDPETMPYEEAGDDENESPRRKPLLITYEGIPGAHMTPVNAAAKAMCEKYKEQHTRSLNPVNSLTITPEPAKT